MRITPERGTQSGGTVASASLASS